MNVDITQINLQVPIYYVINLCNDQWVKISELFSNLEEAKQAYSNLIKEYPFARMDGCFKKDD